MMSKEKLYVVKIGGNVIDNEAALDAFLDDFSKIKAKKILVHGGGKIATEISKGLGIEAQMIDGRTLKIVTMVYGGLINKNIVCKLQSKNTNALGLTGADANMMLAKKRPVKNGIDYGFVGDVEQVESNNLSAFINLGLTPVFAPLTHDGEGNMLNTNADTVASAIAVSLASHFEVNLVYSFELKGVLSDFENKDSVIPEMTPSDYKNLKEKGVISKGMIPKLDNCFEAINGGVSSVLICQATDLLAIVNGVKMGTMLMG
jgi:acetylglutamate kinase